MVDDELSPGEERLFAGLKKVIIAVFGLVIATVIITVGGAIWGAVNTVAQLEEKERARELREGRMDEIVEKAQHARAEIDHKLTIIEAQVKQNTKQIESMDEKLERVDDATHRILGILERDE